MKGLINTAMRLINLGYDNDIRLEMKFARQIKGILGMYFIRQDVEADTGHLSMCPSFRPYSLGQEQAHRL